MAHNGNSLLLHCRRFERSHRHAPAKGANATRNGAKVQTLRQKKTGNRSGRRSLMDLIEARNQKKKIKKQFNDALEALASIGFDEKSSFHLETYNPKDNTKSKPLGLGNDLPELNAGSLLRIAESLEKMERPFLEQITHIKNLEQANEDLRDKLKAKCDQFNGSKGYVKRLENQVKNQKESIKKLALEKEHLIMEIHHWKEKVKGGSNA